MKKLILTIITLTIITSAGCYDPDTATVRINLGNMPIAHHEPKSLIDRILGLFEKDAYASTLSDYYVDVIHVAAYSGNSVIATMSIDALDAPLIEDYDVVEFEVPAGEDIRILVVGEDNSGGRYASYFGITPEPETFNAGETADITVDIYDWTYWSSALALTWLSNRAWWNDLQIPVKYVLYAERTEDSVEVLMYQGYDVKPVTVDTGIYDPINLYLEFEPFNIRTEPLTQSWI